jgi:hypothetical protein
VEKLSNPKPYALQLCKHNIENISHLYSFILKNILKVRPNILLETIFKRVRTIHNFNANPDNNRMHQYFYVYYLSLNRNKLVLSVWTIQLSIELSMVVSHKDSVRSEHYQCFVVYIKHTLVIHEGKVILNYESYDHLICIFRQISERIN